MILVFVLLFGYRLTNPNPNPDPNPDPNPNPNPNFTLDAEHRLTVGMDLRGRPFVTTQKKNLLPALDPLF